jgi:hypothetical protein
MCLFLSLIFKKKKKKKRSKKKLRSRRRRRKGRWMDGWTIRGWFFLKEGSLKKDDKEELIYVSSSPSIHDNNYFHYPSLLSGSRFFFLTYILYDFKVSQINSNMFFFKK